MTKLHTGVIPRTNFSCPREAFQLVIAIIGPFELFMKILLTGGGTGGHFYPLIAVAEEIREDVAEQIFIGDAFANRHK